MSYEWIRRRKRYLSFRYLFPELVAPWIQLKRGILRLVWFITHPVDEFFEDLGELIAWPFVLMARFFSWLMAAIGEFLHDLVVGIEIFFRALGRLPVWTGGAIAGALGVVMTILLFLLQVTTFDPVPLSTAAAFDATGKTAGPAAPQPVPQAEPEPKDSFDIFAGSEPAAAEPWRPTPQQSASLSIELERLRVPFDPRERVDVVSTVPQGRPARWSHFERVSAMNGWNQTRRERARHLLSFTPYVRRQSVSSGRIAPSWVTTAASVSPFVQVQNRREPAVSIVRTAPESAQLGGPMTYELIVSNQGLEPLDSVTVHETVSAMDRVMNVQPPANVVNNMLVWNVTNLQPREQRTLTIELRPDQLVPVTGGSTVRVKTGIAAVSRVRQPVPQAPPITPAAAEELNVWVPEPNPEPARTPNPPPELSLILPTFDDEPEPAPAQQPEPELTLAPRPARPPKPAPAILPITPPEPVAEPTQSESAEKRRTTAEGGGVPIFFEMRTPKLAAIDHDVRTVFHIRNPGTHELTDLVILVEVTDELDHKKGRILEHRIARLAPGAVYQTRLTTTAVRGGLARVRSTLTSAEDLESTLEAEIDVGRSGKQPTQLSRIELPDQGLPTSTQ